MLFKVFIGWGDAVSEGQLEWNFPYPKILNPY